jgi:hypothetical protein
MKKWAALFFCCLKSLGIIAQCSQSWVVHSPVQNQYASLPINLTVAGNNLYFGTNIYGGLRINGDSFYSAPSGGTWQKFAAIKMTSAGKNVWDFQTASPFKGIVDAQYDVGSRMYYYGELFDTVMTVDGLTAHSRYPANYFILITDTAGRALKLKFIASGIKAGGGVQAYAPIIPVRGGGFYYAGASSGDLLLDTILLNGIKNKGQYFLARYDDNANIQWAKPIGNSTSGAIYGGAADSRGNIILNANFGGTASFDKNYTSLGPLEAGDIIVMKLDSSANYIWAKRAGDIGSDEGNQVLMGRDDNVYVTGFFSGNLAWGDDQNFPGNTFTTFIAKLNQDGSIHWIKTAVSDTTANYMFAGNNSSGHILVSVNYQDTVTFDGKMYTGGYNTGNVLFAALDTAGQMLHSQNVTSSSQFQVSSVQLSDADDVFILSRYHDSLNLPDGHKLTSGSWNFLLWKTCWQTFTGIQQSPKAYSKLILFPNPAQDQFIVRLPDPGYLSIYDMLGKEIFHKTVNVGDDVISSATFQPGSYIVKFRTEEYNTNSILIKQ